MAAKYTSGTIAISIFIVHHMTIGIPNKVLRNVYCVNFELRVSNSYVHRAIYNI